MTTVMPVDPRDLPGGVFFEERRRAEEAWRARLVAEARSTEIAIAKLTFEQRAAWSDDRRAPEPLIDPTIELREARAAPPGSGDVAYSMEPDVEENAPGESPSLLPAYLAEASEVSDFYREWGIA